MGWLPTQDRSGRLMVLGAFLTLIGLLSTVLGSAGTHSAGLRAAGLALTIIGIAALFAGTIGSAFGQEKGRARGRERIGGYYGRQIIGVWRSMPPPGKVAFGLVAPITTVVFGTLAWFHASPPVVLVVVGTGMTAFAVLLAIAGRSYGK